MKDLIKRLRDTQYQAYLDGDVDMEGLLGNAATAIENQAQNWIPVTEPPKKNGYYLCVVCVSAVNQRKEYRRKILFWEDNVWIDMPNCFRTNKPLYWMPLPSTEGLE